MNYLNIRQLWLDYYYSLGFDIIPGAPLVHPAFPMSFNMSAGLVQLDPQIRSPKKVKPGKQVLIQKCFRHFDIDKVGDDTHLTFFEMPGAFEIGEFDEVKTVEYIWNFLTQILHLDQERLWITSFHKDTVEGTTISQPRCLIKYLKSLAGNRLVLSDKSSNLWMQGGGIEFKDNIRMCGPQVEFFYDYCSKPKAENFSHRSKNNPLTCPSHYLELSNIVFIKYFVDYADMKLKKLLNQSTEAVIGLERVAAIIESLNCHSGMESGKTGRNDIIIKDAITSLEQYEKPFSVFSSTFFQPLFNVLNEMPQQWNNETIEQSEDFRTITNHLKSLLFILTEEEVLPGRNGRNRIIRTLVRQLLTSCYLLFGCHSHSLSANWRKSGNLNYQTIEQLLSSLIDSIIVIYKSTYPEIQNAKSLTLKTIFDHEKVFQKTLETGKRKIQKYMEENKIKELNSEHKTFIQQNFGVPAKLISL